MLVLWQNDLSITLKHSQHTCRYLLRGTVNLLMLLKTVSRQSFESNSPQVLQPTFPDYVYWLCWAAWSRLSHPETQQHRAWIESKTPGRMARFEPTWLRLGQIPCSGNPAEMDRPGCHPKGSWGSSHLFKRTNMVRPTCLDLPSTRSPGQPGEMGKTWTDGRVRAAASRLSHWGQQWQNNPETVTLWHSIMTKQHS